MQTHFSRRREDDRKERGGEIELKQKVAKDTEELHSLNQII